MASTGRLEVDVVICWLTGDDSELGRHIAADRTGFTYSVLDPADGDVVGCLWREDVHAA